MRAFSLVELSIVLVILGLLTGGILTGQSLIRAAELRTVSVDIQQFSTATQAFRDKYMAIPGDMPDATRFWGYVSGVTGCTNRTGTTATSPGTCDGDGNGKVSSSLAVSSALENLQFWRQLGLAGLIAGTFSGVGSAPLAERLIPGGNCPLTRAASPRCWMNGWLGSYDDGSYVFSGEFGNVFYLAGPGSGLPAVAVSLRPEELWNIDTKLDDGKPATGKIVSTPTVNCAGTTDANDRTAEYAVSVSSASCGLYVVNAF